jgi:hypothetical protein
MPLLVRPPRRLTAPAMPTRLILLLSIAAFALLAPTTTTSAPATTPPFVTYEDFGAKGDGATDDLPAIVAAHAHANQNRLPVRSRPDAHYHLGVRALTAVIQTDTDWNTSRFTIDDSQGVEDHKRPLFEVRSRLDPVPLQIERLSRDQPRLHPHPVASSEHDLLVLVENSRRRLFIRRGANQNSGTPQREVFILRRDGSIEGAIDWDYETVTRVEALPIDPEPLVLRGGVFTHVANRMKQEVGYNYWARNIEIRRSNTEINGLTLRITGEGEFGHPYNGFLRASRAANITFRDCQVAGRKVYTTLGNADRPVPMGTYALGADLIVNFRLLRCRMDDIHDTSRWGVAATNFMKNVLVEDCVLSRMDVHQGVSGSLVVRRTTLGHQGLKAVGRGLLLVEDTTVHSQSLIDFRTDYGSTWDGEVVVRNSRWAPPSRTAFRPAMFNARNDGMHDFGYPCSMPRTIRIEGLFIDDSATAGGNRAGVTFFGDVLGSPREQPPFPFRLTERLEIRDLKTASGVFPDLSPNQQLASAIDLIRLPALATPPPALAAP